MRLKYRPEIDGLRAIAVLAVLVYHMEVLLFDWVVLPGGFLGVDIFFVISGFLITGLIIGELEETGKFSYKNFYLRRTRRILPALFVVILVSAGLAWAYLNSTQIKDFSWSAISTLLFSSNFYWHFVQQEYGAESSLLKPLLHTWSLSVEEQYYILFPVIFCFCFLRLRKFLKWLLFGAALLSLAVAIFSSSNYPSASFYFLHTRMWELLAGGILAYYNFYRKKAGVGKTEKRSFLSEIGLVLIALSLVFVNGNMAHPSYCTTVVIAGTLLVLAYADRSKLTMFLLSNRPMVGIGLISYSLYLWHYPIYAFARLKIINLEWYVHIGLISLTFALSIASYFFIEKPFRNRQKLSSKIALSTLTAMACVIAVFSALVVKNDGYKSRFADLTALYGKNEFDNQILRDKSAQLAKALRQKYRAENNQSWFSNDESTKKVVIFGNSHGQDLFNAFIQNNDLFDGYEFALFSTQIDITQDKLNEMLTSPRFTRADIVIISSSYYEETVGEGGKKPRNDIAALPAFIEAIKKNSQAKLMLCTMVTRYKCPSSTTTIFDKTIQDSIDSNIEMPEDELFLEIEKESFRKIKRKFFDMNKRLKKMAEKHEIILLEKGELIIDLENETCDVVTPDGYKCISDDAHWTLEGAKHYGQKIHAAGWLDR